MICFNPGKCYKAGMLGSHKARKLEGYKAMRLFKGYNPYLSFPAS
jgi:hypothetical protein